MADPVSPAPADGADPESLDARVGHRFADPALLELATHHRSWCAETPGAESNERLEFLGDAVLQLVVTERLYESAPEVSEGVLAQRRAALVNSRALSDTAREVRLGEDIRLGRGERSTGGADKESILADATEAVIGAVYLDGGFDAARRVVLRLLATRLRHIEAGGDPGDPKSRLQERAARDLGNVPRYDVSGEGPDHAREFEATVALGDDVWGRGRGSTKKEAEQAAAAEALGRLVEEGHLTDDHG
ncbi:MAG: ribonuclease III [Microthrixaceae bacterium]